MKKIKLEKCTRFRKIFKIKPIIFLTIVATVLIAGNFYLVSRAGFWLWDIFLTNPLSQEEIEVKTTRLTRHYPDVIKGSWEPNAVHMAKSIRYDGERLKKIGINTVSVSVDYGFKDGSIFVRDEDKIISNIVEAKNQGFAVWVALDFGGSGEINFQEGGTGLTMEKFLKLAEEEAIKWAAKAEKYQVEYFGPLNELDFMIWGSFKVKDNTQRAKIVADWYQQVLPQIKTVFQGKTIAKFAFLADEYLPTASQYQGYDYVGIGFFHNQMDLVTFREYVRSMYAKIATLALNSPSQWLVLEAWFPFKKMGPVATSINNIKGESLDKLQDDYYQISMEEYLRFKENRPAGYFFHAWTMPFARIKGRSSENIIKDFFHKI